MIYVKKINEVWMFVTADPSIEMELREAFTFEVPGFKYMPAYKQGIWDGMIRSYDINTKRMHCGLLANLRQFAEENKYGLDIDPDLEDTEFSVEYIEAWLDKQQIYLNGELLELRDYQHIAILNALHQKRMTLVSPTSSGKTAILYCISKFLMEHDKKVLIQVPSIMLVEQMESDFLEYSKGECDWLQKVAGAYTKEVLKPVVVSTWQSQHSKTKGKADRSIQAYFNQFDAIVQDEVHQATATVIKGILENCTDVPYRFGCTGTLTKAKSHANTILGLFGQDKRVITTKELMERGQIANLSIKMIELKYSAADRKALPAKRDYHTEIDFIVNHPGRLKFVANLAKSLPGVTLILVNFIDKHLKPLQNLLETGDKEVYVIHGQVAGEEREVIRRMVKTQDEGILLCSYATMSTGVSIPNINNVIFASPTKSMVRVLQSVGRGLRLSDNKSSCALYDIMDNLQQKGKKPNISLQHGAERIVIYATEGFKYKVIPVELK